MIPGIYVPSLYEVTYKEDGTIAERIPLVPGIPAVIAKEMVREISQSCYPKKPVVPFIKVTQDRVVLEIQRGCIRGCRFARQDSFTDRFGKETLKCWNNMQLRCWTIQDTKKSR